MAAYLSLDGFLSGNKTWRGGPDDDAHHTGSNVP